MIIELQAITVKEFTETIAKDNEKKLQEMT